MDMLQQAMGEGMQTAKNKKKQMNTSGTASPGKAGVHFIKNYNQRIALSSSFSSYSSLSLLVGLSLPLVAWSIVGGIMQIGEVNTSSTKYNLIKAYTTTAECYNVIITSNALIMQLTMWQDTIPSNTSSSSSVLEHLLSIMRSVIIPDYQQLLDRDMGNFTTMYKHMMQGDYNLTATGQSLSNVYYPQDAGVGPSAFMNGNILATLTQLVNFIDRIYAEWKLTKGDVRESRKMFNAQDYKTFFFYSTYLDALNIGAITNCYYALAVPLSAGIISSASQSSLSSQLALIIPLLVFLLLFLLLFYFLPLFQLPPNDTHLLFLFPLQLLATNQPFVTHLKRLHRTDV